MKPVLYMIIPCYNEEKVLPVTAPLFFQELQYLIRKEKIGENSRILFVNDGSRDGTWGLIEKMTEREPHILGLDLSRNRGHQNAVFAGLMEAREQCDITITIDCDGQDDIQAMEAMVDAYEKGSEIVYGVRSSRETDTAFKRGTAQAYYRFLHFLGAEVVYNHADYRLASARVLRELAGYREVNLFLRGMFPLVGFPSSCVYYSRKERMGGKSHYPLKKMAALAVDGITSLSVKPLRLIFALGMASVLLSLAGICWAIGAHLAGMTVSGWSSMVCILCFMGGLQLLGMGIMGEYIGKIYMETKGRPRYIVNRRSGKWETAES